jgi:hypothetical protein
MGRRGSNSFRRNDAIRALRSALDAGMSPSALDVIIGKDGAVTFRVYGAQAAGLMTVAPTDAAAAREWQDEIAKLKGRAPKAKGR